MGIPKNEGWMLIPRRPSSDARATWRADRLVELVGDVAVLVLGVDRGMRDARAVHLGDQRLEAQVAAGLEPQHRVVLVHVFERHLDRRPELGRQPDAEVDHAIRAGHQRLWKLGARFSANALVPSSRSSDSSTRRLSAW